MRKFVNAKLKHIFTYDEDSNRRGKLRLQSDVVTRCGSAFTQQQRCSSDIEFAVTWSMQ